MLHILFVYCLLPHGINLCFCCCEEAFGSIGKFHLQIIKKNVIYLSALTAILMARVNLGACRCKSGSFHQVALGMFIVPQGSINDSRFIRNN